MTGSSTTRCLAFHIGVRRKACVGSALAHQIRSKLAASMELIWRVFIYMQLTNQFHAVWLGLSAKVKDVGSDARWRQESLSTEALIQILLENDVEI